MRQSVLKWLVVILVMLEVVVGIALIALGANQFSTQSCLYYIGHGVWVGLLLLLTGITGVVYMGKRRWIGITHVCLALLCFFVMLPVLVGLNTVEMQSDSIKHCWAPPPTTNCTRLCSYVDFILQQNVSATRVKRDLTAGTTESVLGFELMPDGSQSYLCRVPCTNDTRNDPAVVDESIQIIFAGIAWFCLLITTICVLISLCQGCMQSRKKTEKVKPINDGFFGSDPNNLDLSLRPTATQPCNKLGTTTSGMAFNEYKPRH